MCWPHVQEHVQAARFVCFNLGFLPGGDRSIISQPATSVAAVKAAMNILEPGGIISVLAYVGHPGKTLDLAHLYAFWLSTLHLNP